MESCSNSISSSIIGIVATGNVSARDVIINSLPPQHNFPIPQLISTFRGREDEITQLDDAFFVQKAIKIVICGLGGFGKSELSKQYAQRCLNNKKVEKVLWIPSENLDELKKSYTNLKLIYDTCVENKFLFIFDNCINQQSITDYEPYENKNHLVLITSQYNQWGSDVVTLELRPLSSKSAIEVFKSVLRNKYRNEDGHLYETLADSVDNIPLGLQIIAGYVEQADEYFNFNEYVEEIKKSQENIIDETIPDCVANSYNKSIYGAMITSLDKIKDKRKQNTKIRKLAVDVLCMSAFLKPEVIFIEQLLSIVNILDSTYKLSELRRALILLTNYFFLRYGDELKSYITQHRIIQSFVRYYLSKSEIDCNYYRECLNFAFNVSDNLFRNMHRSSILNYADSNITTVYDFYLVNKMNKSILTKLIEFECIACIHKIFDNCDEQKKKCIYQYDLLAACALNQNVSILNVLLQHVDINGKNDNEDTALHKLAKWPGYLEGVEFLIAHGADLNIRNKAGDPPLFTFVPQKNIPYVQENWDDVLKIFKFDTSITNSKKQTLLHLAIIRRNADLVNCIIKYAKEINQTDNQGWAPLDTLYNIITTSSTPDDCINDNKEILIQLLTHGALSNSKHTTENGETSDFLLLDYTIKYNNLELLELLLNNGVEVNSSNEYQQAVINATVLEFNLQATKIFNVEANWEDLLKKFKFDNSVAYNKKQTLLHLAVARCNADLVNSIIKYDMEINQTDNQGWTPLDTLYNVIATSSTPDDCINDNKEILIQLLKHGALSNIKHTTDSGKTSDFLLLNYTLKLNNLELLELLLNSGVDVNSSNEYQQTIIYSSVVEFNLQATKILIEHKADLNVKDIDKNTPIFCLVKFLAFIKCTKMDLIKQMLDLLQCSPKLTDSSGNTLLHLTSQKCYIELINMLVEDYKFDVNQQNSTGDTPLHALIASSQYFKTSSYRFRKKAIVRTIQTLKRFNARLDIKNKSNETPLRLLRRVCPKRGILNFLGPYLTPNTS